MLHNNIIFVSGNWKDDFHHVHYEWIQHLCVAQQTPACVVELVFGEQTVCVYDDVLFIQHVRGPVGLFRCI